MKKIAFIISLFYLYSCSPQWHIEKADKHKNKALKKGATITRDTTYVSGDTIVNTYWKDSILYVDRTITDTIYIDGEVRYVTKKDKRIARRKERKADRYKYKLQKQEIKADVKKAKRWSLFWIGFTIGAALMFLLMILIRKYYNKLKSFIS
jgi:predicted membrane channel-forming protein YqfA (hemolysin III family)